MVIYKITNTVTGKSYIGKTKDLKRRLRQHRTNQNITLLSEAIKEYGWESFGVEILYECDSQDDLNLREIEYISLYNTLLDGYNMTYGGDGGECGNQFTKNPDTAKKAYTNMTDEERERCLDERVRGDGHYTKRLMSEEDFEQWKLDRTGENNGMYGMRRSDEWRKEHSERMSGRPKKPWTEERKRKMSENRVGSDNPRAKTFRIKYPDGRIEVIKGLEDYCRKNNTTPYKLRKRCEVVEVCHSNL